ncbi:hypothetical protein ACFKIX_000451 [Vibrio alginolyticus]
MKILVEQPQSPAVILVERFRSESNKSNQNRNTRIKEVRKIAADIAQEHGKIDKLDGICKYLYACLKDPKNPKRDSWGYKFTSDKLEYTVNRLLNN